MRAQGPRCAFHASQRVFAVGFLSRVPVSPSFWLLEFDLARRDKGMSEHSGKRWTWLGIRAVGVQGHAVLLAVFCESLQVGFVIRMDVKGLLPLVPANIVGRIRYEWQEWDSVLILQERGRQRSQRSLQGCVTRGRSLWPRYVLGVGADQFLRYGDGL